MQHFAQFFRHGEEPLLREVKQHADNSHPKEDVDRQDDELTVHPTSPETTMTTRPQLTKSDRHEGDETGIRPVDKTPALPRGKYGRPEEDVH